MGLFINYGIRLASMGSKQIGHYLGGIHNLWTPLGVITFSHIPLSYSLLTVYICSTFSLMYMHFCFILDDLQPLFYLIIVCLQVKVHTIKIFMNLHAYEYVYAYIHQFFGDFEHFGPLLEDKTYLDPS